MTFPQQFILLHKHGDTETEHFDSQEELDQWRARRELRCQK